MKNFLFLVIRLTGLPFLFREIVQRNKVTIVLFHDIDTEIAEQSFSYLSRKYNLIGLNDFIQALKIKDRTLLPKKALIITFDDGHIGNYALLPIIKRYNIPVTIFLCAAIVNTKRHFWFRYEDLSLPNTEVKRKSVTWYEDLRTLGYDRDREFKFPQSLQRDQIVEMSPYVNFQSHTLYHPILPKCTKEEARKEIRRSKEILEHDYGLQINAIAYPNGDYSVRDISLVKESGYHCGVTVDFGYNSLKSDIFRLKRLSLNDTDNISELIVRASGVWALLKTLHGMKQGYGICNNIE